jgi:hypothetical protein
LASAGEARLTYITRFKAKKILNGEEQVAERLVYTRCFDTLSADRGDNVVDGLVSAPKDKRVEVSITADAKAQAIAQFKADKPRPCIPDKPSDKTDKPDKNKAKPKDRTGRRPLPSTDKAHKKTEADKEELRGDPPRRFMHTRYKLYASSRAAKLASMERYRRERASIEVDPGGRHDFLPKQSTTNPVQPRSLPPRRYLQATHLRRGRTRTLRGNESMDQGAHHIQQIRVLTFLSRQARKN